MSNLKIKVAYCGFDFEIEGTEQTVKDVFNDVRSELIIKLISNSNLKCHTLNDKEKVAQKETSEDDISCSEDELPNVKKKLNNKTKYSPTKLVQPQMIKLKLNKEQHMELINRFDSLNQKSAASAIVILYYIYKEMTGVDMFDLNLTFTLLRTVKVKVPKILSQTLIDIKNKKQHIVKNEDGTFSLHYMGEHFVETMENK